MQKYCNANNQIIGLARMEQGHYPLHLVPLAGSGIAEILGNNGRFRLMTDEGLCQQLPKWIEQYAPQEELQLTEVNLEHEAEIEEDPLLSGYEASMPLEPSLLLDAFQSYDMEVLQPFRLLLLSLSSVFQCLPFDFMSDIEPTTKIAVKG
ncbi:unnamed protein product [Heligmosomoides polygyrus]|uniref:Rad21_Rec8 domain-containing protein n=1 Tax=Heligmosomoides polygyrus TaxID=6339 RepID=A0A183GEL2_HELPZ|nr:unnamed protein product [Heligmosomoides polygyrus]